MLPSPPRREALAVFQSEAASGQSQKTSPSSAPHQSQRLDWACARPMGAATVAALAAKIWNSDLSIMPRLDLADTSSLEPISDAGQHQRWKILMGSRPLQQIYPNPVASRYAQELNTCLSNPCVCGAQTDSVRGSMVWVTQHTAPNRPATRPLPVPQLRRTGTETLAHHLVHYWRFRAARSTAGLRCTKTLAFDLLTASAAATTTATVPTALAHNCPTFPTPTPAPTKTSTPSMLLRP